jgi:hypothetical protein
MADPEAKKRELFGDMTVFENLRIDGSHRFRRDAVSPPRRAPQAECADAVGR